MCFGFHVACSLWGLFIRRNTSIKSSTYLRWTAAWWIAAAIVSPALAQTPAGTINSPIYATGYISQVGGTNVTTKIPPQPNHPTNLNIYLTSAVTGTWTIQLPNPAFEGQVLSFNCGATASTIAVTSTDGSDLDTSIPTNCGGNTGFTVQFDQRNNIWRNLGSNTTSFTNIAADNNTQLSALSSIISAVIRLGYANAGDAPPLLYTSSNSACSLNSGAGDGGSQVPTSDGKCWLATFSTSGIDIRQFCPPTAIVTDISTCAQAAINAAGSTASASYGGAIVYFPAVSSPYKLTGTLVLNKSFVSLNGDSKQGSYISCANGSADCIQIGQSSGSQIRDNRITNLGIWGNGAKTAGAGVHIQNAYNITLQNVDLENMIRGVDNDATTGNGTNGVTLRDVDITINQASSDYGIYWHAPGDGTKRSDVLSLYNVVMNGAWGANTTGILMDGFVNTSVGATVRLLRMKYGLRIINTAASASYYPNFINWFDLEAEGFLRRAISIEAGSDLKFVGSDMNNLSGSVGTADDYAVYIGPDTGASETRGVQISNSRIGASQSSGLYDGGRNTQLNNIVFFSTSLAGSGSAPVIKVGSTSQNAIYSNVVCEEYGGAARASYCVETTSGAVKTSVSGFNFAYVTSTPWYNDAANSLSWTSPKGGFGVYNPLTDGGDAGLHVNQDAWTTFKCLNNNVSASAGCRLTGTTGTSNSYFNFGLLDNSGSPYQVLNFGSAVKALQFALPPQSTAYLYFGTGLATSGATLTITDQKDNAIIEPSGTLATLTVVLPTCSVLYDGKISTISTTQTLTALTVNATAGTVGNPPTTLSAGGFASFQCRGAGTKWYRRG